VSFETTSAIGFFFLFFFFLALFRCLVFMYTVCGKRFTHSHVFQIEGRGRRRFSDFVWLYDEVLRNNLGYIVPPLPEASVFNKVCLVAFCSESCLLKTIKKDQQV
jgi:hypothetical protein